MFGIGRSTAWGELPADADGCDDDNPPLPTLTTTDIEEILGYKKKSNMYFVIPDATGTISVGGVVWKILEVENPDADPDIAKSQLISLVKEQFCRWVYIETTFEVGEFSNVTYRQLGLYSDLTVNYAGGGTDEQTLYTADEITEGSGILEIYQNRTPITKESDIKELIGVVLEF